MHEKLFCSEVGGKAKPSPEHTFQDIKVSIIQGLESLRNQGFEDKVSRISRFLRLQASGFREVEYSRCKVLSFQELDNLRF